MVLIACDTDTDTDTGTDAVKRLERMPEIEFSIDGIIFGEADLSIAKSKYSSRDDYKSNEMGPTDAAGNFMPEDDTVYSMPHLGSDDPEMEMRFGYWFIQSLSGGGIYNMGTRTEGFTVLGKYRIGDNASNLIYDILGIADINDIPTGYTVFFDDGTDMVDVNKRGEEISLRCIVGNKGLEVAIENNLIIQVRMFIE